MSRRAILATGLFVGVLLAGFGVVSWHDVLDFALYGGGALWMHWNSDPHD